MHHPAQLPPGYMLHGWRVVKLLGAGTYGAVYRVEMNGQHFAMKIAMHRPSSGDDEQADARLQRELGCLVHLHHANIVGVLGHGRWPDFRTGWLYVVLDLVEGHTLAQWVERMHPTAQEVVRLFMKLAGALDYMHGRGVFHRDLKLVNIMVRAKDGEPVILDFSAGDYMHAEDLTDAPLPPGTRRYRTPEAARFLKEHGDEQDARYAFKVTDDVYALGICLYDVLTAPAPASDSPRTHVEGYWSPMPAKVVNARVPATLSDVAMGFIERRPENRPPTAEVMRRELASLAAAAEPGWTVPIHAPSLKPSAAPASNNDQETPPVRRVRRARWVDALLAVALVALLAGAFVGLLPASSPLSRPVQESSVPPASLDAGVASFIPPPPVAPGDAGAPLHQGQMPTVASPGMALPPPVSVQKESSALKRAPIVESPPVSSPKRPLASSSTRGEFLKKCAAASAALALQLGCPSSSQVRPETGTECPEEAREVMPSVLWLSPPTTIQIHIDVKHQGGMQSRSVYSDGPVTGIVWDGTIKLPKGSLLYGRMWTGDGNLLVRYTEARLPNGDVHPVCISVGEKGPVKGWGGSKPGAVVYAQGAIAFPVERWP
ncbi:protein kinase [Corallococcus sp. ZKHCc1 1396]|uniref:non-specific serine/threonine protein kinase n=1 Tax=Corallococcus soli TaxID=2710757 RepID=A0ABR9PUF4_9BACT|nr:protein kinase [Corallococcus soli]